MPFVCLQTTHAEPTIFARCAAEADRGRRAGLTPAVFRFRHRIGRGLGTSCDSLISAEGECAGHKRAHPAHPHTGDTNDFALEMMLFGAARLAAETEGDPVAERRRRRGRSGSR